MNTRIAREIFGHDVVQGRTRLLIEYANYSHEPLPNYSTDMDDTWAILRWLDHHGLTWSLSTLTTDGVLTFYARITTPGGEIKSQADTLPLAICRAALKVAGGGE